MRITLDYHREGIEVDVPDRNLMAVLRMRDVRPLGDARAAVSSALELPAGSPPLVKLARGRKSVCVVVSDITRPVPNHDLLPPILADLERAGISRDRITILVATGLHRPNEGAELAEMVGPDLPKQYRFVNHFARERDTHAHLGETEHGLPILVDKTYVQADLKVATGMIEPHLMAGYSGGRKSILPGIAAAETIMAWHTPRFIESPKATYGILDGNPVHESSTEFAKRVGIDFIVNVVLNKRRDIIGVFAGDMEEAFREGCQFVDDTVKVSLPEPADIVVTSSAGYPLDTTFYQAVKGLTGALPAVKAGGTIVMVAGLRDGIGGREFIDQILSIESLDAFMTDITSGAPTVIDQWQTEELAKVRRHADVMLYSDGIPSNQQARLFVEPVESVEAGIERALSRHGQDAKIVVIPAGPYVIPQVA